MDVEKKAICLINAFNGIQTVDLLIKDYSEDGEDSIILGIEINHNKYCGKGDNHFDALMELRRHLEKDNVQIMCNGSGRNVYPSAMQFDFGNTRKAYKMYLGNHARMADLVDIFDCEEDMAFVSIDEQMKFNAQ